MSAPMISKLYKNILNKYSLFNLPRKDIFIVLGESRSGTSLIMELLKGAGIFVGHSKDLKKADLGNLRGYFEYKKMRLLDSKPQNRVTQIRMVSFLRKIQEQARGPWALKIHPNLFPRWQPHLPFFKLIIIFKHPLAIAHSNIKLKKFKHPFHDYILKWEKTYREAIYYYSNYPGVVIKYEDLVNPGTQNRVLQKLVDFMGRGDTNKLRKIIDTDLDRSSREIDKLKKIYPLPQSTKEVWDALEKIKV